MKNKILFLVDYWSPIPTANAVCTKNVIHALQEDGWECYVSAFSDEKKAVEKTEGITVHTVKPAFSRVLLNKAKISKEKHRAQFYAFFGKLINRINRLVMLPVYPIISLTFDIRWSREICRFIQKEQIDYVVSVIDPQDSLYTGYLVKKQNPKLKWTAYYIDCGSNVMQGTPFEPLKRLLQRKAIKWENKVLSLADKIIVMQGHEKHYRTCLNEANRNKLRIADVPLFVGNKPDLVESLTEGKQPVQKWVYTGSMTGVYYDPHQLVEFFQHYQKYDKAELHLYGTTDQVQYLTQLTDNTDAGVAWHGIIPHNQISGVLHSADVLVYYKNISLDSVSGKFFEYVGYQKPVVYFGDKNDINARLVQKYPKGIIVSKDNWKDIVSNLPELIMHKSAVICTEEQLKKIFYLSTPQATAEIISSVVHI